MSKREYPINKGAPGSMSSWPTGGAKWGMFKSGIERAWNDLEGAFEKWAN
jgi:hypothetical protein